MLMGAGAVYVQEHAQNDGVLFTTCFGRASAVQVHWRIP